MTHHRAARRSGRLIRGTVIWLVASTATAALPVTGARAAITPMWGGSDTSHSDNNVFANNGNGKFNRNDFSVNSPSFVHGIQHVFNQNVGGKIPLQAATCRRKLRHCKIVQRIVMDP